MPNHQVLGPGREFDAVRQLLARWGALAEGIGDDAAMLAAPPGETLLLSTDSCCEHVHFEREWLSAQEVGVRATSAALSDIAAMGGRALALLIALELPREWEADLAAVADGIGAVAARADARIIGGNIVRGDRFAITTTAVGAAARPVRRNGALPGDVLYLTGLLGGPDQYWRARARGEQGEAAARARFTAPVPRLAEGQWLAVQHARAMIDISDGVLADARHIASASHVVLELWPESIPRLPGVTTDEVLQSGEEYELLVALPPGVDVAGFAEQFQLPLTRVGRVRSCGTGEAPDVVCLRSESDGAASPVGGECDPLALHVDSLAGHDHLST